MMPRNLQNDYYNYNCESDEAKKENKHCSRIIQTFYFAIHYINFYDVYRECVYDANVDPSLWPRLQPYLPCIQRGNLEEMLNDPEFMRAFNVDVEGVGHWSFCGGMESYKKDVHSVIPTLEKLRHKYKLLIYVGDTDEVLGFGNGMRVVKKLGWETKEEFKQWYLDKEMVGYKWVVDGLTLATVHGVGHLAAQWKPREVQSLIYSFIDGEF